MHLTKHLIVVAGGTGTRMKSEIPKQFIEMGGKAIIIHTLEKFFAYDNLINTVVVSHKNYVNDLNTLFKKYFPDKKITICEGGETRFYSVQNGLKEIPLENGIVGIHDAARPLVSFETISKCFEAAAQKGNAIPVVNVSESLRRIENNISRAVNRNDHKIVQTPQCFKIELIKKAFEQSYTNSFTDDATVLERMGEKINLVEGNVENIKITTPEDLIVAGAFLR